jgi:hypothetical protein
MGHLHNDRCTSPEGNTLHYEIGSENFHSLVSSVTEYIDTSSMALFLMRQAVDFLWSQEDKRNRTYVHREFIQHIQNGTIRFGHLRGLCLSDRPPYIEDPAFSSLVLATLLHIELFQSAGSHYTSAGSHYKNEQKRWGVWLRYSAAALSLLDAFPQQRAEILVDALAKEFGKFKIPRDVKDATVACMLVGSPVAIDILRNA